MLTLIMVVVAVYGITLMGLLVFGAICLASQRSAHRVSRHTRPPSRTAKLVLVSIVPRPHSRSNPRCLSGAALGAVS